VASNQQEKTHFSTNKGMKIMTVFFVQRESCKQLRLLSLLLIGCHTQNEEVAGVFIIVLTVHAPTEDKIYDVKGSIYE
jgi:hypothetical protein